MTGSAADLPLSAALAVGQPQPRPQEFDTACALANGLLQRLLGGGAAGQAKRLDDGGVEGEPCAGALLCS